MFYILGAVAIGAGILAIYERKKNQNMVYDDHNTLPHERDRAGFTEAERIRAEGNALQTHSSSEFL